MYLSKDEEKVQQKANWAVHTLLYENVHDEHSWRMLNVLPVDAVLAEVNRYAPEARNYFLAWMMAGDLLKGIINK